MGPFTFFQLHSPVRNNKLPIDGTDGLTDGLIGGRTDRQTDRPSQRDERMEFDLLSSNLDQSNGFG